MARVWQGSENNEQRGDVPMTSLFADWITAEDGSMVRRAVPSFGQFLRTGNANVFRARQHFKAANKIYADLTPCEKCAYTNILYRVQKCERGTKNVDRILSSRHLAIRDIYRQVSQPHSEVTTPICFLFRVEDPMGNPIAGAIVRIYSQMHNMLVFLGVTNEYGCVPVCATIPSWGLFDIKVSASGWGDKWYYSMSSAEIGALEVVTTSIILEEITLNSNATRGFIYDPDAQCFWGFNNTAYYYKHAMDGSFIFRCTDPNWQHILVGCFNHETRQTIRGQWDGIREQWYYFEDCVRGSGQCSCYRYGSPKAIKGIYLYEVQSNYPTGKTTVHRYQLGGGWQGKNIIGKRCFGITHDSKSWILAGQTDGLLHRYNWSWGWLSSSPLPMAASYYLDSPEDDIVYAKRYGSRLIQKIIVL